jgi:Domain of unknown function (DUF6383)
MKTKRLLNSFSSAKVIAVIVLMALICSTNLCAQDTFTWNGSTSADWTDANNWTIVRGATAGADTYPGQTRTVDYVLIQGGITGTPNVVATFQPTLASGTLQIGVLTITNLVGPVSGSILTINTGATLTVRGYTGDAIATPLVLLQGGNIVNNGTLNITSDKAAKNYGIICAYPKVYGTALVPEEFSYSGTGALTITQTASTSAGCASINNVSVDPNSTYKFLFNGTTTLNMPAIGGCFAIMLADQTKSPFIIGGTGFSVGSAATGSVNSLISLTSYNAASLVNLTINSGTTLSNYVNTNTQPSVFTSMTNGSISFTNKGTINISGTNTKAGIALTNSALVAATLTFDNQGTITTDIGALTASTGVMHIYSVANNLATVNVLNSGSMTLKNTTASCYGLYVATNAPTVSITNSGTLSLYGLYSSTGGAAGKTTLNNTGTVTTLSSGLDKVTFNNNSGGILDCKTNTVVSGSSYPVTIGAGSTLKTANTGGLACIGGTLPNSAVLNAGANYVFNGVAAQTTGATGTAGSALTANNIEINNVAGVTLSNPVTVNGVLTMTAGILTLGAKDLTIGTLGSITPSETNIDASSIGRIIKLTTALQNNKLNSLEVLANANVLTIKGLAAGNTISLFNTSGQQVKQIVATGEQSDLALPKGIYIVKANTAAGTKVAKVVM